MCLISHVHTFNRRGMNLDIDIGMGVGVGMGVRVQLCTQHADADADAHAHAHVYVYVLPRVRGCIWHVPCAYVLVHAMKTFVHALGG